MKDFKISFRKLNHWMVNQEESNIGMLLFIVVFFAMLCVILATVAIGYRVETQVTDYPGISHFESWDHIMSQSTKNGVTILFNSVPHKYATNPSYALIVTSTVMGACAWLAVACGWYFDPTKLDERLSTSLTMGFLVLQLIFGIASVGNFDNLLGDHVNKGYVAGQLIMIIIPTLIAIGLTIDPMIQSFNPNNKNEIPSKKED